VTEPRSGVVPFYVLANSTCRVPSSLTKARKYRVGILPFWGARLELESRPPWFFAVAAGMDDSWMDLRVDADDLRAAAEDLRRDLARFPPRPL
jgi:hypothetical protein